MLYNWNGLEEVDPVSMSVGMLGVATEVDFEVEWPIDFIIN
jgi:hypothetical protein